METFTINLNIRNQFIKNSLSFYQSTFKKENYIYTFIKKKSNFIHVFIYRLIFRLDRHHNLTDLSIAWTYIIYIDVQNLESTNNLRFFRDRFFATTEAITNGKARFRTGRPALRPTNPANPIFSKGLKMTTPKLRPSLVDAFSCTWPNLYFNIPVGLSSGAGRPVTQTTTDTNLGMNTPGIVLDGDPVLYNSLDWIGDGTLSGKGGSFFERCCHGRGFVLCFVISIHMVFVIGLNAKWMMLDIVVLYSKQIVDFGIIAIKYLCEIKVV